MTDQVPNTDIYKMTHHSFTISKFQICQQGKPGNLPVIGWFTLVAKSLSGLGAAIPKLAKFRSVATFFFMPSV